MYLRVKPEGLWSPEILRRYYGKPGESNYLIEFTNEIWKQQVKKVRPLHHISALLASERIYGVTARCTARRA